MKQRVFLCLVLALTISSCDQIRGVLGLATSSDIAKAKQELLQKEEHERFVKDSIAAVEQRIKDSLDRQMKYADNLKSRFYVIVGSFKKDFNTSNMLKHLTEQGYKPVKIALKNGFDMVAIFGADTYTQACKEMVKIEDWDTCPYDVWVYDVKQNLHE